MYLIKDPPTLNSHKLSERDAAAEQRAMDKVPQTTFHTRIKNEESQLRLPEIASLTPNSLQTPITLLQALLPAPFLTKPLLHRHCAVEFN